MRWGPLVFWIVGPLVIAVMALATWHVLSESSARPVTWLAAPVVATVCGGLVSVLWTLIKLKHKSDLRLAQGWRPAMEAQVADEVAGGLLDCSFDERVFFQEHRVPLVQAPIWRYGREEQAWIVARRGDEVILWDDRENGFEIAAVGDDLRILEHWRNAYELHEAVHRWMHDLPRAGRGPEMPRPGRDGGASDE